MLYLTNGFSVHMFGSVADGDLFCSQFEVISRTEASYMLRSENFRSFFGHSDTAQELSRLLKVTIRESRELIVLKPGDRLIIATIHSKRALEKGWEPERWFRFWYVTFVRKKVEIYE